MKTGIELITLERNEQIEKHGRSIQMDTANNDQQQLAFAAACLAYPYHYTLDIDDTPLGWDVVSFMKMKNKPALERLAIAGALIAAEIDRLNNSYSETN